MNEVILQVEGIRKSFPGVQALDGVKLELRSGEVHALVGENGAGKSTLMKILSGVHKTDEGTITYKGRVVTFHSAQEAQKAGISIIFQELNLIPHLTVAQNIFIGREPRNALGFLDERKLNADASEILKRLNLRIRPESLLKDLPISQQQMVEIAKALSHESEVLIMDEPTSALTESEISELFEIIHKMRSDGVGIIYISHRLEELKHIVDRISIFRDGHYISTDEYSTMTIPEIVNRMVGRRLENKFPQRENIPTKEVILEARHISRKERVRDISFQLFRGEILGIAGLMGAGRSELARAIFGADPIDSGEVYLGGEKLTIKSPSDAIRNGIAYLSENRKQEGLAVRMRVAENITMANVREVSQNYGIMSQAREERAARKYVDDLDIRTPSLKQVVNNLSGGNQQKVVVAKWLFSNSKVLFF